MDTRHIYKDVSRILVMRRASEKDYRKIMRAVRFYVWGYMKDAPQPEWREYLKKKRK